MRHILVYLRDLSTARQVLWCYLIWYGVMVTLHFEAAPRLWITSLGISMVIGVGLVLSVANRDNKPDFWTLARLFMMPFCVSSFSALIKDRGFILILSPRWQEDALAATVCLLFLMAVRALRKTAQDKSLLPFR